MYLVVGLGNPEPEYSVTRHNMGFDVINKISQKCEIDVKKKGFQGLYGTGIIENQKVILLKPQTFMNLSGDSIIEVMKFYKIPIENLIVIYDDMDIEIGTIKIRPKGSSAGHNGIKSIVYHIKTEEFKRVRIGIGRPEYKEEMVDYVVNKVTPEQYTKLSKGIDEATEAVIEILKNGIDSAMNKFN